MPRRTDISSILVIGSGASGGSQGRRMTSGYPSLAHVAGHALSGIFLDALTADVERLQRINRTLALLSDEARVATPLRQIDALVIAPSQHLEDIAARHVEDLPSPVRGLLRGVGVHSGGNAAPAWVLMNAQRVFATDPGGPVGAGPALVAALDVPLKSAGLHSGT